MIRVIMTKMIKVFSILIIASTSLFSISLKQSVEYAIVNNPDVVAELINQEAFKLYIDEERADYLPRLDWNSYLEDSNTYENRDDSSSETKLKKDGWHSILKLEQILYDGGISQSEVAQKRHTFNSNKFRSKYKIEKDIVLSITQAYTNLVMYNELINLSRIMIKSHEDNLATAKEKENISGEVLETYQVSSKLFFTIEKYLEQEESKEIQTALFKRYVGLEPTINVCRPNLEENLLPKSLEQAVTFAIRNNYEILEKIEDIKKQAESLSKQNGTFLPTITFELQAAWDDDLELDENGRQDIFHARLNLNWNLFSGGKDFIASSREKLFLQEAKKDLEVKTNEVKQKVISAYEKYQSNKKRIEALRKYSQNNLKILEVYQKDFEAGTRTFVDILNAESELYTSNTGLIKREYEQYSNYYQLLLELSMLSDSILSQKKQECSEVLTPKLLLPTVRKKEKIDASLDALFDQEPPKKVIKEKNIKNKEQSHDPIKVPTKGSNKVKIDNKAQEIELDIDAIYEKADDISSIEPKDTLNKKINKLLEIPSSSYTINLATLQNIEEAKVFIRDNNIGNKAYAFEYGRDEKLVKVLYGSYNSLTEAKKDLKNFNKKISEYDPYIDNVKKHQDLFKKYNN